MSHNERNLPRNEIVSGRNEFVSHTVKVVETVGCEQTLVLWVVHDR